MERQRLLLSLPYGMSARNILRSEAWTLLRRHADILMLTPLAADPAFRHEFEGSGVEIRDYLPVPLLPAALLRLLTDAESLMWIRAKRIKTFEIIGEAIRQGVADDLLMANAGIFARRSRLLAVLPWLRRAAWAGLNSWVARASGWPTLLAEWRPTAVFLTHPYAREERLLTIAAQQRGIRRIAMIHSWDNPTTKPKLLSRYDRVIVWNEIMKEQMVRLYDYMPEQVRVSGMPQADVYARRDLLEDRATFMRRLGADPGRRLVTFACGCPEFVPDQHEITGALIRALDEGRLAAPVSLVIRLHPGREFLRLRQQARPPTVIIDEPTVAYTADRRTDGWRRDSADVAHFVNLLAHSDVFINAFSTTSIDAAAMDTPIVNIAFDADGSKPYYASLRKHYDWNHYRPIVESGGVRLAGSPAELIEAVNAYLRDPALDRNGRRRIVSEQCGWLDGRCGRRIAETVLEAAGTGIHAPRRMARAGDPA